MIPSVLRPDALRAFLLCLAGGIVCSLLQTPLPWMIGPLLAMAAGKLGGLRLAAPRGGRHLGQLLIGTALGLYFTPGVARQVLAYGPLMLLAAAMAILLGYGCGLFLARITGTDRTTAFFGSVPGGAAEMAVLGEQFGAAVERVALAQSLRILLVVMIVPAALTWSGAHGVDPFQPALAQVRLPGLALLLALAALGGVGLQRLRIPNAWMLGPLAVSIALTVTENALSAMPSPLTNAGQLLVGCALGSRFERSFLASAPRYVAGVTASILLALAASALFGLGFAWLGGLAAPTMLLATAPGGIAEMCITAKVLRLGVPLVTAFHVTRVIVLVTGTAPLFRWAKRRRQRRYDCGER